LPNDDDDRDAVEVANPDRLRQQVRDEPDAQQPACHEDAAHHQREQPGQGDGALGIARSEREHRRRDDRREGRIGPQHEDA
jgi:hypothetical protein